MPDVRLSVALVTRNRLASLDRTLRSLRAQSSQPHEVVVSDDSDATTAPLVRSIVTSHGCTYVRGPQRGLYANRNASALACSGTHIRTMDDDHEFPVGHIAAVLAALTADPDSVWIIGECWPDREASPDGFDCPPQLDASGFSATPETPDDSWAIADGASVYPRVIFDRGERFDEAFPFGASYLEWGCRLHSLGYRIRHLDTTFVVHHYDPRTRSFLDARTDRASRLYAALCHSFLYVPTFRNRLRTGTHVVRSCLDPRAGGVGVARNAWTAYRRRRAAVESSLARAGVEIDG